MINVERNARFRQIRAESGLSQKDFGAPMGMTRDEVKNVEYDKTELKPEKVPLFCHAYGIQQKWYLEGEGPKHAPELIGDALGALTAEASKNTVEDADAYFARIRAELGDAKFLMLYEIFRSVLPQYDKPIDGDK